MVCVWLPHTRTQKYDATQTTLFATQLLSCLLSIKSCKCDVYKNTDF